MTLGNSPSQSPADGVSKACFIVSLVVVLTLHLLIFWLVKSPSTLPDKPKPLSFLIELGKALPPGAAGQEAVESPETQALTPAKVAPTSPTSPTPRTPSTTLAPLASKGSAQLPQPTQTSGQKEQQGPSEPLAQPQAINEAKAEPAEPVVPSTAKASIESVRTSEPDYKAAYLNNARPPYPRNAHRFGIEGRVVLQAEVNEEGVPMQIQVFQSSGNELLDESALNTVAKWRFSPARKDGVMVRALVKIPITFSLKATSPR